MHKFSDFSEEYRVIKIKEIIGKTIEFHGYQIVQSKYPKNGDDKCIKLTVKIGDEMFVVFSGSKVLRYQSQKYEKQFPFISTIIRGENNKLMFS